MNEQNTTWIIINNGNNSIVWLTSTCPEDMKKRGLASSDCGDALAVTFAHPVAPKGMSAGPSQAAKARREYNPLAKKY